MNRIESVGHTNPTAGLRCDVYLCSSRQQVITEVGSILSHYREIRPPVLPSDTGLLRHVDTNKPLTPEWLLAYLPQIITFYDPQGDVVPALDWLLLEMLTNADEFPLNYRYW